MVKTTEERKTSTVSFRIWRSIYKPYRSLSKEAKITVSDLISLVLYHTAFDEPLIAYILQEEFEIDFETAKDYASKLASDMEKVGDLIWGEEENGEEKA